MLGGDSLTKPPTNPRRGYSKLMMLPSHHCCCQGHSQMLRAASYEEDPHTRRLEVTYRLPWVV